jgi:hypothetical protein
MILVKSNDKSGFARFGNYKVEFDNYMFHVPDVCKELVEANNNFKIVFEDPIYIAKETILEPKKRTKK